jgi:hypothetical protein
MAQGPQPLMKSELVGAEIVRCSRNQLTPHPSLLTFLINHPWPREPQPPMKIETIRIGIFLTLIYNDLLRFSQIVFL